MMLPRHYCAIALLLTAAACTTDNDDGKRSEVTRGSVDAGPPDAGPNGDFDQDSAQLTLSCRSAVLTETETSGFLAKVSDAQGRVPAGNGLWVRLTPSTGTVNAAKAGGAPTDKNGEVSFSYVAPHFDFATSIVLEASVIGDKDRVLAKEQCSFKVVTEAFHFLDLDKDSTIRSDRATPFTIEVLVDGALPSCEAGGGINLTLTGPSGAGLSSTEDGDFDRQLCTDLTDAARMASAYIRGGQAGGSGRVRASLAGATLELPLKFLGPAAAVELSSDATEIEVKSGANLTITATDDTGQALPGVAVQLELTRCAASSCSGGEAIAPVSVTTDMSGKATAAYFAGDGVGAAQLTATLKSDKTIHESIIVRVVAAKP